MFTHLWCLHLKKKRKKKDRKKGKKAKDNKKKRPFATTTGSNKPFLFVLLKYTFISKIHLNMVMGQLTIEYHEISRIYRIALSYLKRKLFRVIFKFFGTLYTLVLFSVFIKLNLYKSIFFH